jgi:RNA polymerase sigma-70 factor (sigma-E family)
VPASDDEFSEVVRSSSRGLLRTAWLLVGDAASAEDLVQAALARTWVRWDRIRSKDAAQAYVQRVMVTTFLGWRRRRWTAEVPSGSVPEITAGADAEDQFAVRDALVCAVRALPPHQRAVVALRYFNDLSEAATAEILGCSVGAVKSQSFRAMQVLRATPGLEAAITGESV